MTIAFIYDKIIIRISAIKLRTIFMKSNIMLKTERKYKL